MLSLNAKSQMKADGKWHFPDSVRNMCINKEQNIIATFRTLIERNREWMDESLKIDKSNYLQLTEALKRGIVEDEQSWERLGCVYIIYGARK
jgi:hypothetical protein